MSTQQIKARLYSLAILGLITANKGNQFWSKSDAMTLVNKTRGALKCLG